MCVSVWLSCLGLSSCLSRPLVAVSRHIFFSSVLSSLSILFLIRSITSLLSYHPLPLSLPLSLPHHPLIINHKHLLLLSLPLPFSEISSCMITLYITQQQTNLLFPFLPSYLLFNSLLIFRLFSVKSFYLISFFILMDCLCSVSCSLKERRRVKVKGITTINEE